MIGLFLAGGIHDELWDGKLLYRVAGQSILEHTITAASQVEVCHQIVVCLNFKDSPYINGTAFSNSGISKDIMLKDSRVKFHFSERKGFFSKIYEACIKYGITYIAIIDADAALTPPWLVKEAIMAGIVQNAVVETDDSYPQGIGIKCMPFHVIANIVRFEMFDEERDEYTMSLNKIVFKNTVGTKNYIYNGIMDLRFSSRTELPMLDAMLTDIHSGMDLDAVLREWNE